MQGGKTVRNDFGFSHLSPELRRDIARQVAACSSWSVIFSDWQGLRGWDTDLKFEGASVVRVIPWIRWSMPQLSGDRPPQGWEPVILAWGRGKGRKSWDGPGNLTHFDEKRISGGSKHKTQKPLDLMLRLVRYFTEPGASIIDPCAGRGTTVLAAKILSRYAVGFECNETEARLANERLVEPLDRRDLDACRRDGERAEAERADRERMAIYTAKVRKSLEAKALPTTRD